MAGDEKPLTVSGLARAVTEASGIRCTPRMIYNYESKGLIDPPGRSTGGVRLYPVDYVAKIASIKELQRDYKLSLDAIRHLLGLESPAIDLSRPLMPVEPRSPSAPSDGESRRDSLIRAAELVLRAKGYRATTIDDIVREAGVAKGTFYLYFQSKQELFLSVLEKAVWSLEEHLEDALDGVKGPLDRLEKRALSYMRGYLKYRDLIHILYGESVGGNKRFQQEFKRIYETITSTLQEDIAQVADRFAGSEVDPELLSYALVGAGEMLAYRVSIDGKYQLEEVVKHAIGIIRGGDGVEEDGKAHRPIRDE